MNECPTQQPKTGQFDLSLWFLPKTSRERVKPWFFVTFNIIRSHLFPESFNEARQVV